MPETRCSCGGRTFYKKDLAVTRSDGVMMLIASMPHLTCVRCEREWLYDVQGPGQVELREVFHTVQADKEIMRKAIHEHRNRDGTEPFTFAAISEEDWKGYEEVRPS